MKHKHLESNELVKVKLPLHVKRLKRKMANSDEVSALLSFCGGNLTFPSIDPKAGNMTTDTRRNLML